MFNTNKNSYLQLQSCMPARLLNRAVNAAMGVPTSGFDAAPPLQRLCSEQPCIPIENIDVTRADCAFGRWALPKLYKELHSDNWNTKLKAINTICDLVKDPEKSFEAIRLNFVDRLIKELLNYPDKQNEEYKERVLLALQTLASQAQGRDMMLSNRYFTAHLKKLTDAKESNNVRCKVAAIIKNLTDSVTARWTLIDDGYVNLLIRKSHEEKEDDICHMLLISLERLLIDTEAQEIGFESDGVERMVDLMDRKTTELVSQAGRCLALLISHPTGKKLSLTLSLLDKLNDLLHDERREVYMTAAQVIMFATHTVRSKHDAAKMKSIAIRLLDLANDFKEPAVQMFSIRALTNICEHPAIRQLFLENYLEKVKAIITNENPEVQHFKSTLIKVIEWKPWIGYVY